MVGAIVVSLQLSKPFAGLSSRIDGGFGDILVAWMLVGISRSTRQKFIGCANVEIRQDRTFRLCPSPQVSKMPHVWRVTIYAVCLKGRIGLDHD